MIARTGGCQCGAVRYRIEGDLGPASICHCRMCQKAFGSFFAPLVSVSDADLTWTRGKPAVFASSDVVDRGFCAQCGTPLTFVYRDSGITDIAIGSFDRPEEIEITSQVWASARIAGFDRLHTLPARREDEPAYEAIVNAVAATNHQHPDHDTDVWPPQG